MDPTGLINKIITGTARVDRGRNGLRTDGGEHEGRLLYEKGIAVASSAFSQAVSTADPHTLLLAEEAFVEQKLRFCSETDMHTRSSLTQALQSFEDAFLCLETVEDITGYKAADNTWPHNLKYRIQNFPKDAFHLACYPNKNIIRAKSINP